MTQSEPIDILEPDERRNALAEAFAEGIVYLGEHGLLQDFISAPASGQPESSEENGGPNSLKKPLINGGKDRTLPDRR